MTLPDVGEVNSEWVVETYSNVIFAAGGATLFSSSHRTVVSEAVFISGQAGGVPITSATVIAHGRSVPDQGSVAATVAATLAPQQFLADLYASSGTVVAGTVVTSATFLVRGR
jgi:hypothetical protein